MLRPRRPNLGREPLKGGMATQIATSTMCPSAMAAYCDLSGGRLHVHQRLLFVLPLPQFAADICRVHRLEESPHMTPIKHDA
ncbi:hypothetical protein HYPSUDRAFT_421122 [Hypholoma sublateritium FD-334 SS-4]|uniref:Uncharacterized protein n=1 Tax=Hypholoma sublateritium (strain FD-334 SS-4) TaxID=945553 RepID=A0A0D2LD40_HYPSF|nr:hypothetical protein HYPSUDRAFT_421122 [Hypholoma sublateritium FD-334 SS-4]